MIIESEPSKVTKAMVFGVFDGLHPGHHYFLEKAANKADQLVVVITLSEVVNVLKGKMPLNEFSARVKAVKEFNPDFEVVAGDLVSGEWQILKTHQPDIVILGYDQAGIAAELEKLSISYYFLDAHQPEIYKSSLLNN